MWPSLMYTQDIFGALWNASIVPSNDEWCNFVEKECDNVFPDIQIILTLILQNCATLFTLLKYIINNF